MTPMENRFRGAWIWSQDGAPDWFCAWIGEFMWRPWCWARGYHRPHHCDAHFEICTWCRALLWSRRRDGGVNPLYRDGQPLERAPATWRRWLNSHPEGRPAGRPVNRYCLIPHRAQPGWNPQRQAWTCKRCDARTAFTAGPWHGWALKIPGADLYRRFRYRHQARKQIRWGLDYIRRTYGARR